MNVVSYDFWHRLHTASNSHQTTQYHIELLYTLYYISAPVLAPLPVHFLIYIDQVFLTYHA